MIVTVLVADPVNSSVHWECGPVIGRRTQETAFGRMPPANVKATSPEGEVAPEVVVLVTVAVQVEFWLTIIGPVQTRLVDVGCTPGLIVAVP